MKKLITFQVTGFLCFLLLLSTAGFSQTKNAKGITDTMRSQLQTNSAPTEGAGYYRALVYYSAKGNQLPKTAYITGDTLNQLMERVHSISNGAEVGFEYLEFVSLKGDTTRIKEIPYHFGNLARKVNPANRSIEEIKKLKAFSFISGMIYFSGAGFSNVVPVKASDIGTLYSYYSRSVPGTIITLDNCIFKNNDGSLAAPISKIVIL